MADACQSYLAAELLSDGNIVRTLFNLCLNTVNGFRR